MVLTLGWLLTIILLGGAFALMSIGGDGGLVLIPFAVAALIAMIDRVRNVLTTRGAWCVGIASVPVVLASVAAVSQIGRGGGYVLVAILSVCAVATVATDITDRLRWRIVPTQ